MKKQASINFNITLDEQKVPEAISWQASDAGEDLAHECKAIMLSMWDKKEENTLRIDLWTKDMMADEMKLFFHQTFVSMINALERSTGADSTIEDLRAYSRDLAKKLDLMDSK